MNAVHLREFDEMVNPINNGSKNELCRKLRGRKSNASAHGSNAQDSLQNGRGGVRHHLLIRISGIGGCVSTDQHQNGHIEGC